MRFLDPNVFIYAYYRPRRELSEREKAMKDSAKDILSRVSEGKENVVTTVVHVSEAVNILKHGMPLEELVDMVLDLFTLNKISVLGISYREYLSAIELGRDLKLDPNDALAVLVMRLQDLTEIYSFDQDFERIKNIVRLPLI